MEYLSPLFVSGLAFGRNFLGIILKPYEAQRRVVEKSNGWELVWIGVLLICYFSLASLVKVATFRPFLLTKHFLILSAGVLSLYSLVVLVLWLVGMLVGGKGTILKVALGWAYTLIPTVCWFFMTSLLYVLLPPPRTTSVLGILFSVVFLVISATLFWWKVTLGYLAIRFGMKLDLAKILIVLGVTVPIVGAYSWFLYRIGIFKVPFI